MNLSIDSGLRQIRVHHLVRGQATLDCTSLPYEIIPRSFMGVLNELNE